MERGTLHAFDRVSNAYAQRWDAHPTARWMRARVIARCQAAFAPGGRVLDLGCGTGTDARLLAALGYAVTAVDGSRGMVAEARARGVEAAVVPFSALEAWAVREGPYDGVLSDFGALNCAEDLAGVGRALARLLRPGGAAVLVTMSPFCPAEWAAHGWRVRAAWRRRRSGEVPLEGGTARVRYWSVAELERGLAPLRLEDVEALGAVVPPPDLGRAGAWGLRADAALGRLPGVRRLGDHTLTRWRAP